LEAREFKARDSLSIISRLKLALTLLLFVLTIGVAGYVLIENWPVLDALYMTVITITTVGFREVKTLSSAGKIFTLCLIVGGVGTGIYALGIVIEFLVEGHLRGMVGERKMKKKIESLKGHYILCGFGRVGQEVAKELKKRKIQLVVIENNPETILKCEEGEFLFIDGDATDDKTLELAGIAKAKGLIAAIDTDADNVFVVLSAKSLNPKIFVVARANSEESEEKLKKAGADKAISPTVIGGRRMASLVIKPIVCDYLDVVTHGDSLEFQLEELKVKKNSEILNKTLAEADIRSKTGTLILAIKREREFNTNPSASTRINEGDLLIAIGTRDQLDALQMLV